METIRTFQSVREGLFRLEEGAHLLEAVRRLFPEEEGHPGAFNLLVRGVAQLAAAPDRAAACAVVLATRVKLLLALGYLPELDTCVQCGGDEYLCGFHPAEGGVLCARLLRGGLHDCFSLSPEGLDALRTLVDRPLAEVAGMGVEGPAWSEVERAVGQTPPTTAMRAALGLNDPAARADTMLMDARPAATCGPAFRWRMR